MNHPKRKHPRLKCYDYRLPGLYYVTIHTDVDAPRLSTIAEADFGTALVKLSEIGIIAEQQLFLLEKRFPYVRIDKYVIMPNHIHVILELIPGEENRTGLTGIVGAYKSLTTRHSNQHKQTPGQKLFQTSFYETVLRDFSGYQECWKYIDANPAKWLYMSKEKSCE